MPQRQQPDPLPTELLDWGHPSHWSRDQLPCRYCRKPTNLRDSRKKPAHKVCAEEAIARQNAEAAESYQNERQQFRDQLPNPPQG